MTQDTVPTSFGFFPTANSSGEGEGEGREENHCTQRSEKGRVPAGYRPSSMDRGASQQLSTRAPRLPGRGRKQDFQAGRHTGYVPPLGARPAEAGGTHRAWA